MIFKFVYDIINKNIINNDILKNKNIMVGDFNFDLTSQNDYNNMDTYYISKQYWNNSLNNSLEYKTIKSYYIDKVHELDRESFNNDFLFIEIYP